MIDHPAIAAASATIADIVNVLVDTSSKPCHMVYRAEFVDHFRCFRTDEPNGLGGFIWRRLRGRNFNQQLIRDFLATHEEIRRGELIELLCSEADLIDDYFER